jgi:hypothetical protein
MLRRLTIVAALTIAAGTALSAPAHAAGHTICVGSPVGTCDEHQATIHLALSAAAGNGQTNTILVGPGTYSDGPYILDGSVAGLTVRGSGQGVTTLTAPANAASQYYVDAFKASVQSLTIALSATNSSGDKALSLEQSSADQVTVTGPGTGNVTGILGFDQSTVSRSTVQLPLGTSNIGMYGFGGGLTVHDSAITADYEFTHTGSTSDTLSRVSIQARVRGIDSDGGDVDVDDTLIDLGAFAGAKGIAVDNTNNSTASKTITANHVTIVGGGSSSYGVYAHAASATALQHAAVILGNSIIRGPATDLYAVAGNDGAQGGNSDATIAVLYSDWHSQWAESLPNGTASIAIGAGNLDVDAGFRDPAHGNYRLAAGSPLVDKGMPGTSGLTLDLDGSARLQDGNSDGTATRDMGAYEAPPQATAPDTTAPDTTLTSHPRKRTTKRRATFGFTSNEVSIFQCKVDAKPWVSCTSPKSFRVTRGWHRFQVRAIDAAHNVDATPAKFRL